MKLCASNIAWEEGDDDQVYKILHDLGFHGLEVAPTRWAPENPYEMNNIIHCKKTSEDIRKRWGLHFASMQSIWYGKTENIFGGDNERLAIYKYMCKAIDFAQEMECHHIVLGCPKNRKIISENSLCDGIDLIKKFAQYASSKGVVIGLEANPIIYGTNFINTNLEAEDLIRSIDSPSLRLNLDFGAIIENEESLDDIKIMLDIVSHVHISEPFLDKVRRREGHNILSKALSEINYKGYISLEMKKCPLPDFIDVVKYMHEVF